jgi:NADPH2:quinone reductase
MKAVHVEAFGGPEVLELRDLPAPAPGPGEVLLQIAACGLNWSDLLQRQGLYPGGPRPPFVPGQEAAGVVVAHGPGVEAPARGARVAAIAVVGMHAACAVVPARSCLELPPATSFEEGAAAPVALLTAAAALTTVGRAVAGETVIVHAAGGGLGTAAVQIARRLGLRVIATASSPDKRARVQALGADVVCGYDDFPAVARDATAGRGADLVVDGVGGDLTRASLAALRPFGRLVLVGLSSGALPRLDPVKLIHRSQAVLGFHLRGLLDDPEQQAAVTRRVLPWLADGSVRPQVGEILPLAEIRAAHARLAGRGSYGKIVLVP